MFKYIFGKVIGFIEGCIFIVMAVSGLIGVLHVESVYNKIAAEHKTADELFDESFKEGAELAKETRKYKPRKRKRRKDLS